MNNATKINIFNSDNTNITNIKTQNSQIMTGITNGVSKFEIMNKIAIVVVKYIVYCHYFYQDQLFYLNQFCHKTTFIRPIYQNQKVNIHGT